MSQSFPNLGRKMVGNEKMRRSRKVRRGYAWTIGLWAAVFIGLAMIAYPRFEDRAKEREQLELLSDWSLRIQASPQPVRAEAPKPSAPPAAAGVVWMFGFGFLMRARNVVRGRVFSSASRA